MKRFTAHVGGILVVPRRTLIALERGAGGGLTDLVALVLLELLALRLAAVVRAVLFGIHVSAMDALMVLLNLAASALLVPIGAAVGGGLLLALVSRRPLFGPRPAAPVRTASAAETAAPPPGQRLPGAVDLAALCVMPLVVLQLAAAVVQAGLGWSIPAVALKITGGAWGAALLALAWQVSRSFDHRSGDGH